MDSWSEGDGSFAWQGTEWGGAHRLFTSCVATRRTGVAHGPEFRR